MSYFNYNLLKPGRIWIQNPNANPSRFDSHEDLGRVFLFRQVKSPGQNSDVSRVELFFNSKRKVLMGLKHLEFEFSS